MSSLLFPAINFTIYVCLLVYLYKKHIKPLLVERSKHISEQLKESEFELNRAIEGYEAAQNRLGAIEGEKSELSDRFEEEGTHLSKLVIRQAEEAVERLRGDTSRQIETELNQASLEIRQEVVEMAAQLARQQIEQSLSSDDDKRLRKTALESL